jgi:hypothetical protein
MVVFSDFIRTVVESRKKKKANSSTVTAATAKRTYFQDTILASVEGQ